MSSVFLSAMLLCQGWILYEEKNYRQKQYKYFSEKLNFILKIAHDQIIWKLNIYGLCSHKIPEFTHIPGWDSEIFLFWGVVLGFEVRASNLLHRHSTIWATAPALFALVILEVRFHFLPRPLSTWSFCLCFPP
jgi:hypothetical protein